MQKVRQEVCNSEAEYISKKPINATPIFFKTMEECSGVYEISNKGHIRSSYGNKKILKYQYYSKSEPRINLRNKNKKQEQYYISKLMAKYHPKEIELWRENNCT